MDDGLHSGYFDLAPREGDLAVDSMHPDAFMLRSDNFTLPASGTVRYYALIGANNDSLFKLKCTNVKYALDFYDTSGNFVSRLDSIPVSDSANYGSLRTVTLGGLAQRGYLAFHRIAGNLVTAASLWQDIIRTTSYSHPSSDKRSVMSPTAEDIALIAVPNPLKKETTISFAIPQTGAVTLEITDVLGRRIASLANQREFHAGGHSLLWNTGNLQSGAYLTVMHYGNTVKTLRLAVLK